MDRSQLLMIKGAPFNAETPLEGLRELITPTALHYVRSNFDLPQHDGTLQVTGAVEKPLALTVAELKTIGEVTLTVTLECAGNGRVGLMPLPTGEPWTGQAVATATWTGVPLQRVLARAKPQSSGVDVGFTGADHGPYRGGPDIAFVRSLALDRALDPTTRAIIAWEMNGEPLNQDHGAPLRLVIPGWYGMGSVKWLSDRGADHALPGPVPDQVLCLRVAGPPLGAGARDAPEGADHRPRSDDDRSTRELTVRGKAWSGSAPVTQVEVSIDGAGEWRPVQLRAARTLHLAGLVLRLGRRRSSRSPRHPRPRHRRHRRDPAR